MAQVEYKQNEIVTAPKWLADRGYHLVAFEDLFSAIDWHIMHSGELWLAEATGIIRLPARAIDLDMLERGILKRNIVGLLFPPLRFWPPGTVMCKTIKLLEKVN